MPKELPKTYEAKNVEDKWYAFWEQHNLFHANPHSSKSPYCIVIPPPNVTGVLHMGHALVNTLQDILIRWKRMSGNETLWVPGMDHAGIATQTVVERHLIKTTGKRRKDFTREEFLKHVWDWKEQSQNKIINQLKCLGCSCDWSRLRFTMDAKNNHAVRTIFKRLYDQDLIYRDDYLVNWDPVTQTALADDEVEYEERLSSLWYFKYPLKDGSGYIHVATTRPETMLGDTGIAVSPNDERYIHLVGKHVVLPLLERDIPIIADHHVDPAFGTGAVKITPSHDPNDYQIGLSHQLPRINIMTPDGRINKNGGRFVGLTMEEARQAVVNAMQELGLLEKVEPHIHRVGVSYRSHATIEPYMSKQWFIRMTDFAKNMQDAIRLEKTKLIPKQWESTYNHWISHLRDWCISRQLWWGHRIPIWYHKIDPNRMICYEGEDQPPEVKAHPDEWIQDEDVLDTWFSSALWPFAALGWPEKTPELERFYPNSTLVTAHDILFFWVTRMIMMGEYAMGTVPFPEVFLHGLIYGKSYWRTAEGGGITYVTDAERLEYDLGKTLPPDVCFRWEKMSKSKGNVIDPLEIIEEYGTDAMRMALCASGPQSREIDLDRRRFEEFRNFTNKIWNGARFVLMNLEGDSTEETSPLTSEEFSLGLDESLLELEDRWLLSVLNRTINEVQSHLASYLFDQAAIRAYDFFWKEFCSYYVEIAKPILFGKTGTPNKRKNKQKLLVIILCQAMRLIHPMAPFITEELFQLLKGRLAEVTGNNVDAYTSECIRALQSEACAVAPYPTVIHEEDIHPGIEDTFNLMGQLVYTIRNIRGEMKLPPGMSTEIHIVGDPSDQNMNKVREHQSIISALVRNSGIFFYEKEPHLGFACTGALDTLKILIPLPEGMVAQEKQRLIKEKERLISSIEKVRKQMQNSDFISKAPAELIERHAKQLQQLETELKFITSKNLF